MSQAILFSEDSKSYNENGSYGSSPRIYKRGRLARKMAGREVRKLWEESPGAKNRFDFYVFVQFLGKTSFCAGESENTFLIGRLNVLARTQLCL